MHIAESLRLNALRHPKKTASICEGKRVNYKELNMRVNRLANAFLGLGYGPGDKVALLLYNCTEHIECFAGLTKVGLIPVPINYRLKDADIQAILTNSDSMSIVVEAEFLDRLMSMEHDLKHIIAVNSASANKDVELYEELLAKAVSSEPKDRSLMHSTIMIHTSGTTGLPKGILRSRYAFLERVVQQGFTPDYKMLCVMPLFFSMGAAYALLPLYIGQTLVFAKKFDAEENLKIVEQENINATVWVLTMLNDIIEAARHGKYDLNSMKLLITGGGQFSEEIKSDAFQLFGPILQTYFGASETGPSNFMGPEDLMNKSEANCLGKVFFGNEVVLLDENNNEVPNGEVGRICCKGPGMYDCYYKEPEATSETFFGEYIAVGDLGHFDDEGYLYFEGRTRDIIKTGGINVYAPEVEAQLIRHPEIREVAVIGIPDEKWIEAIMAIIVLTDGSDLSKSEVIQFSKDNLSSFKAIKSVEFVDELPKNLMGKVLKKELKHRFGS